MLYRNFWGVERTELPASFLASLLPPAPYWNGAWLSRMIQRIAPSQDSPSIPIVRHSRTEP